MVTEKGPRMPTKRLTPKNVEAAKSHGKRVEISDSSTRGLALRISEKGRKTWVVVYRFNDKKKRFTLGRYPAKDLATARREALDVMDKVDRGVDPMAEKAHREPTVVEALEQFEARYLVTLKSGDEVSRILRKKMIPHLGDKALSEVQRGDVVAMLDALQDQGLSTGANRALAWTRKFLTGLLSEICSGPPLRGPQAAS
ncbi:Arm DNA-binding domain-containing protein [Thiohalorhabdus methylotrophus]|uniref:Arm DNA-binding domain-containing protein n=1 Tax=Thiohalorhabdus methylotrophus TaxID=3242694 RepID=A0ABV4TWI5_9GAMM